MWTTFSVPRKTWSKSTHPERGVTSLTSEDDAWARKAHDLSTPISRLPVELFCRIVRYIASRKDGLPYFEAIYGQQLLLMLVCRDWRDMILRDRSLWTVLTNQYLHKMPMLIERSEPAPLQVRLEGLRYCTRGDVYQISELISTHSHRIGSLTLDLSCTFYTNVRFLRKPAPLMTSCTLIGATDACPTPLFDNSAPQLTFLRLHGIGGPWGTLCGFPALRTLQITKPKCKPTWHHLVSILQSMPNLRYLELEDVLPSQRPSPEFTLEFPELRSIHIVERTAVCHSFLKNFSFARVESFHLCCIDAFNDGAYHSLLPWICDLYNDQARNRVFSPIQCVQIELDLNLRYIWTFNSRRDNCHCVEIGCGHVSNSLQLDFDTRIEPQTFIERAFSSLPLSTCTHFKTNVNMWMGTDGWNACERSMPHLETVTFDFNDPFERSKRVASFFSLIMLLGEPGTFPSLRSVEFDISSVCTWLHYYCRKIKRRLSLRKKNGRALDHLTIRVEERVADTTEDLMKDFLKGGLVQKVWVNAREVLIDGK